MSIKSYLRFSILILAFVSASAFAEKPMVKIQHWKTQNGVPVYFVQAKEIPMLDLSVIFDAGSSRDGNFSGVANFTSGMLNEGTKTLNANQIAEQFDDVGANFGSSAGRDMANVSLRSLTAGKYLQPALTTFANVLSGSNFPEKAFERVKKQILVGLQRQQQQPGSIASKAFYKALYGNQPYGHPVSGSTDSVNKITRGDLENFYKQYYVAHNAIVVMVGNLSKSQAEVIAQQVVAGLPEGQKASPLPLAKANTGEVEHISFPSEQTHVAIGQVGINRKNPDYFPLLVGNYILGGGSLVSRLFNQVRDKQGLAYSVYSNFSRLRERGPFVIRLQTRNAKAENAIEITQQVVGNFITKGPTAKELDAAKKNIIGSFPLGIASNASIMGNVANIAYYHLPLDYLDTYVKKINAVTIKQIKLAFQKYLHPESFVIVTVGNNKKAAQS